MSWTLSRRGVVSTVMASGNPDGVHLDTVDIARRYGGMVDTLLFLHGFYLSLVLV